MSWLIDLRRQLSVQSEVRFLNFLCILDMGHVMGAGSWNAQTKHRVYVPLVPRKKAHTPSACNTQAWIHKATTQGKAIILLPCSVGVRHFIDEVKKSTTGSKICCSLLCAKTHQYCATCKLCAEKHVWLRKAEFIQRIFFAKDISSNKFPTGI